MLSPIEYQKIAFSVIFILFSHFLKGQERDSISRQDTLTYHQLDEIVVSANRYGSISLRTGQPVRALYIETVNKYQLRSAPEAFMATPGVFVQKTNHGGGSPFVRGLTGNQTLLMIDGIRLSNATFRYGPNQYFNTIDLFSIEKYEVLRGSGSVQYGSDAMGGTIQAFTHELRASGKPDAEGTLITRLGTGGMELSQHGSMNYNSKKISLRGGITWRDFGDVIGGDTTGRQSPTGYREIDFDIKGKIFLSPVSDITFSWQDVYQSNVPVYHKVALENYAVYKMDPQERELGYIKFRHKFRNGLFKSAAVTASLHRSNEVREMQKNNSQVYRTENDRVRSLGLSAEFMASAVEKWSSVNGLEIYNDYVKSSRIDSDISTGQSTSKRGLYPDGSEMTSFALFTIHTIDLKKWNISAGARFNTFIINVFDQVSGQTKLTPSAFTGNLEILRKLNTQSSFFISGNTGFRAPNIDDLGSLGIVDFRYEVPNYALEPEHSFQYQLGYKYRSRKAGAEIFLYRNELNNLIVRNQVPGDTIEGYPVYMKENVEHAFIQGIEAAWDLDIDDSWRLTACLTYTYGQNTTKNEPARRIPPLYWRASVEYTLKNLRIELEWQAAGKQDRLASGDRDDNRIPEGGTPGWSVFNLHTGYEVKFVRIDLSLMNLTNVDYRYHGSGINSYGRSAFITLTINI